MLVRKKKRESAEWVPAALVRAYLDRVRYEERDIRIKLFGEDYGVMAPTMQQFTASAQAPQQIIVNGGDPALARELEALRAQLLSADQRSLEFDRMMNALKAEKAALEQKLKDAPKGTAAPAAGGNPEAMVAVQKEVEDLKAKLQEYEVIEDDLANLKKFQKENDQLKQKIEQYEKGGGANLTVVPGGKAAPETSTTVSGVTQKIDTPVTVISGGAAPAAEPAKVSPAPAANVAPAASAAESNTNVLQPITPTFDSGTPAPAASPVAAAPAPAEPAAAAPAAAAGDKSAKQKEEELLSEFEKMLAS